MNDEIGAADTIETAGGAGGGEMSTPPAGGENPNLPSKPETQEASAVGQPGDSATPDHEVSDAESVSPLQASNEQNQPTSTTSSVESSDIGGSANPGDGKSVDASVLDADSDQGERFARARKAAERAQGSPEYPGVDEWRGRTLPEGMLVAQGFPGSNSRFFADVSALNSSGRDAKRFNEGVQVGSRDGLYRGEVRVYRLTQEVDAAESDALANPQHGPGGSRQYYILSASPASNPDVFELVRVEKMSQ